MAFQIHRSINEAFSQKCCNCVSSPFKELATGHSHRNLLGHCLLCSGQCGLLYCDDAERVATVSGRCHCKKVIAAAVKWMPPSCSLILHVDGPSFSSVWRDKSIQCPKLKFCFSLGLHRPSGTESFTLCRGSFRSLLLFLLLVQQMEAASLLAGMKSSPVINTNPGFAMVFLLRLFCEWQRGHIYV